MVDGDSVDAVRIMEGRHFEEIKGLDVEGFKEAALGGCKSSQTIVGKMYFKGLGVMQDHERAADFFKMAAAQGDADSQVLLGIMYSGPGQTQGTITEWCVNGLKKDKGKAVEFFKMAAAQEHPMGQATLGTMYYTGDGVMQDYGKAAELWEKAAAQGRADSCSNLGVMYAYGQGVKKDQGKAVELFELAGAQGDTQAWSQLGRMYANGEGVKKDYGKAVKFLEKAQCHLDAVSNLGVMYADGKGVKKDLRKAVELYDMAAVQGDVLGLFKLGVMYANGEGVKQDRGKAVQLLEKAAEQGHDEARKELSALQTLFKKHFSAEAQAEAMAAQLLLEEEQQEERRIQSKKQKKKKNKQKQRQQEELDTKQPAEAEAVNSPSKEASAVSPHFRHDAMHDGSRNEDANDALRKAIDADDLDLLVDAITKHADFGTPELVTEARAMRDKIKKNNKKALKQEKARIEEAKAEELVGVASPEEANVLQGRAVEAASPTKAIRDDDEEEMVSSFPSLCLHQPVEEEDDVPEELRCPLSLEVMEDPVICVGDGHTYNRSHIEAWFATNDTSPLTNASLTPPKKELVRNHLAWAQISQLKDASRSSPARVLEHPSASQPRSRSATPPYGGDPESSTEDLEAVYQILLTLSEAVVAMAELGVERATDLRLLDEDDVILLGDMLKKVHRNRLLQAFGHRPAQTNQARLTLPGPRPGRAREVD